ncbi:unnamed protein product, partial [Ectocarpus sp. 13 AM-2016]
REFHLQPAWSLSLILVVRMSPNMMILNVVRLVSTFSWLVGSGAFYARSEPGQPPEYCTVFHHMVKSAGSTIKDNLYMSSRIAGVSRP